MGYKNILHIWFSHFTLTEAHRWWNYFMSLYFNQKDSPCWPRQPSLKLSLKLMDCGRKIQNDVHTDTYYRKPELISWRQINITVFHTRFLSPTDQKCVESSTYWQFFYYRPPGKFRWFTHLGEIVICHTHTHICDALDNRCGFSTSDWLHHFLQFLVMKYLKRKLFF